MKMTKQFEPSTKPNTHWRAPNAFMRTGWNDRTFIMGKRLDDKTIEKYQKLGYYDPAFRKARKEMWERRAAKRTQRDGNFDLIEGRRIFRPL